MHTRPAKFFAAIVFLAIAAPGLAQTQAKPAMLHINPAVLQPAPTLAGLDRKLSLLQLAGVKVAPSTVQQPLTLSVRQPWINDRTYLDFFQATSYSPRTERAQLLANPATGSQSWVVVRWPADNSKRYILDCALGGPATSFRFRRGSSRPFIDTLVTLSGGRAGIVLNPGDGGSVSVMGLDQTWSLQSCEITPVG